jgi:hypothetical protein
MEKALLSTDLAGPRRIAVIWVPNAVYLVVATWECELRK